MNEDASHRSLDDALLWAARMQDPDFDEWEAHIDWLEINPAHPALYRRAALAMSDGLTIVDRLPPRKQPPAVNDIMPAADRSRKTWWLGAGAALAASVAALLVLPQRDRGLNIQIRTAPGVTRNVALAGGASMILNGGTSLRVSSSTRRQIVIERGEVFLRVAHDEAHPFEVLVGNRVLRDVGTAFNVSLEQGTIRLAVAEGAVALDPEQDNVRIDAGKAITITGSQAVISNVPLDDVGSWRTGRLTYANAELRQVASDLSRSFGKPLAISPDLANRRFTGALTLSSAPDEVVGQLADLLGVTAVKDKSGWTITNGRSHSCLGLPRSRC